MNYARSNPYAIEATPDAVEIRLAGLGVPEKCRPCLVSRHVGARMADQLGYIEYESTARALAATAQDCIGGVNQPGRSVGRRVLDCLMGEDVPVVCQNEAIPTLAERHVAIRNVAQAPHWQPPQNV